MLRLPADTIIERKGVIHRLRLAQNAGFTLIEVMLVVAVLAAIAGGAILALTGTKEEVDIQLARSEMMTIKEAILKFKQDTGYLPKQGPFDLELSGSGAVLLNSILSSRPGADTTDKTNWFYSPANFSQLFDQPQLNPTHPLKDLTQWNPDTRRGWRGPYLSQFGEGLVDIGGGALPGLQPTGAGIPTDGTIVRDLRGIADPFISEPLPLPKDNPNPYLYLKWRSSTTHENLNPADDDKTWCDIRKLECSDHDRWGRPYLLFDLDDKGPSDTKEARLVSMGPNGSYDGLNATDLCVPPTGTDDIVFCLLR